MSNNNLYAAHSIRNTLNLLIKHSEGLNEKTDLRKAKTRFINDLNLMKLMCEELKNILNITGMNASFGDINSLEHTISMNENRVKNAQEINILIEVIDMLKYYKNLQWDFTTYETKKIIDDLIDNTKTIHDNLSVSDANKIIDSININRDFNVFSPRAFDGNSLFRIKQSSNSKAIAYGLESISSYHSNAKQKVNRMIKGRLQGSTISNNVFDMLQLTAPVSWIAEYGATGNLIEKKEKSMLRNAIRFLRHNGILIYTMPRTRMTRDMALVFSKLLRDVQVLEKEQDRFYIHVIGIKDITTNEKEDVFNLLFNLKDENIKTNLEHIYTLPSGGIKNPDFFRGSMLDEEELLELVKESGLMNSFWKTQEIESQDNSVRPLLPFNMGQIGLVLTSGCLDGIVQEYPGQYHAIKGMVSKIKNVETSRENQDETSIETISNKVQINLLSPDGEFIELA